MCTLYEIIEQLFITINKLNTYICVCITNDNKIMEILFYFSI